MSGMFSFVSTVIVTMIGDSSQNNWYGGTPRGPITYPNGVNAPPELGAPLAGDALAKANSQMEYYKSRIYWLGNDYLAAKYGMRTPETMTPVEEEMWARQRAVLGYMVERISELVSLPPGPATRKADSSEAVQNKNVSPAPQPLRDAYKNASPEERAELVQIMLLGKAS